MHAPVIAEQNDIQRVLYPLSVLAAPNYRQTNFNFFKKILEPRKKTIAEVVSTANKTIEPAAFGDSLIHIFSMHPFSTPWKDQKTLKFSDVSRE